MTIEIEAHKAALVSQQSEFDSLLSAKDAQIAELNAQLAAVTAERDGHIATIDAFMAATPEQQTEMLSLALSAKKLAELEAARAAKAAADAKIAELTAA